MRKTFETLLYPGLAFLGLISLIILLFYIFSNSAFIQFLEVYISPDGKITYPKNVLFEIYSIIVYTAILWISVHKEIRRKKSQHSQVNRMSTRQKMAYAFSLVLIFVWVFFKKSSLYHHEAFLEYVTVVFLLLASILIFIGASRNRRMKYNLILLIIVGIVLFVLGMEEISWGQTLFNWHTPEVFATINTQNETNIHNIFNHLFVPLYALVCMVIGSVVLFTDEVKAIVTQSELLNEVISLLPSSEFTLWGGIFLFLSLLNLMSDGFGLELTEELFSIFSLSYAMEVVEKSSKKPDVSVFQT